MSNLLKISRIPQDMSEYANTHTQYPELDIQLVSNLTQGVQEANGWVYYQIPHMPNMPEVPGYEFDHGASSPAEVIVALSSAGIFTAVYQAIASYFTRNRNRELTLTKGDISITIKGHSLPEETELLGKFAPELLFEATKEKGNETRDDTV